MERVWLGLGLTTGWHHNHLMHPRILFLHFLKYQTYIVICWLLFTVEILGVHCWYQQLIVDCCTLSMIPGVHSGDNVLCLHRRLRHRLHVPVQLASRRFHSRSEFYGRKILQGHQYHLLGLKIGMITLLIVWCSRVVKIIFRTRWNMFYVLSIK